MLLIRAREGSSVSNCICLIEKIYTSIYYIYSSTRNVLYFILTVWSSGSCWYLVRNRIIIQKFRKVLDLTFVNAGTPVTHAKH